MPPDPHLLRNSQVCEGAVVDGILYGHRGIYIDGVLTMEMAPVFVGEPRCPVLAAILFGKTRRDTDLSWHGRHAARSSSLVFGRLLMRTHKYLQDRLQNAECSKACCSFHRLVTTFRRDLVVN